MTAIVLTVMNGTRRSVQDTVPEIRLIPKAKNHYRHRGAGDIVVEGDFDKVITYESKWPPHYHVDWWIRKDPQPVYGQ